MSARFWVGGAGSWNNTLTTNWSATSGGAGGASAPTSSDDATFDASSGGGTVTLTSTSPTVKTLTMTNAATMTLAGGDLDVRGNVALGANVTYSATGKLTIGGDSTFTSSGKAWNSTVGISFGHTTTLADDFGSSTTDINSTAGSLDGNGHNVTLASLNNNGGPVILGSGTWTITGSGATAWKCTGGTVTANTSTIKFTDSTNTDLTFVGAGLTYKNIWFARGASTGANIITGANTFADLKDTGSVAHNLTLPASATTTVATFTVSGSIGQRITVQSSSAGVAATLSKSGGTVSVDYLTIKDSTATGGAAWRAGQHSINSGNNTGWFFTRSGMFFMFGA